MIYIFDIKTNLRKTAYILYLMHWIPDNTSGVSQSYQNIILDYIQQFMTSFQQNPDYKLSDYLQEQNIQSSFPNDYTNFINQEYQDASFMQKLLKPEQFDFYREHDSLFAIKKDLLIDVKE